VVIHGVSAGAGSVALHLSAYGGRDDGLFAGAIGESTFFPTQPKPNELEWQFNDYVTAVGCSGKSDELACLRAADVSALQDASVATPYPNRTATPLFGFTPTIDGDFIQDYPYLLFEQGKFIQVPIMFGDDTDEVSQLFTWTPIL
jgi:acetylcholinesterase